ncbi:MAG: nicotinate (nicotinamide) nucleotide adenylyltransferase [Proteobacteria bacterium]|nr:nicotinate (nicotinamide) nucleotide adenylyltransferase [Pseudomonadota bacterium]
MSEKIVIFGGSFDPPHQGHRMLADHVRDIFKPEKIIVVPCFIQPLKTPQSAPAEHRLQMAKLMFGNSNFLVSDYEIKKGEVSYSIDTIIHFRELFKGADIYFLMGEDSFMNIEKWKRYNELLGLCKYIVVSRTKNDSSKLRVFASGIEEKYDTEVHIVDDFFNPASSTQIREKLLKGIKPEHINPNVFNYIRTNNLYKG